MNWYSFVYGFGTFVLAYMTYNLYVRFKSIHVTEPIIRKDVGKILTMLA